MGPGDVECVSARTDPKVGGSYRIHMRSSEGDHVVVGRYLEMVPARRLVFTWSWESGTVADSVVTITFHASGDGTDIELMHEKLPGRDSVEKHTAGWNGCLDNLVAHYGQGK
jgi:uncharacterized protein YndB with AHSA1/START domain